MIGIAMMASSLVLAQYGYPPSGGSTGATGSYPNEPGQGMDTKPFVQLQRLNVFRYFSGISDNKRITRGVDLGPKSAFKWLEKCEAQVLGTLLILCGVAFIVVERFHS